jgi:uncharacterized protein (DUF1015 family)
MPIIKPFKGLRPAAGFAEKVASPPYDVLDSEEARALVKNNPYSFLHISKPEVDLPQDIDLYDEKVYKKGKENLTKFIEQGILLQDKNPSFYLYRLVMGNHTEIGIVGCVSVEEYKQGKIKIHEHTREDKEKDRATHVDVLNANTGPVLLTYKSQETINKLIEKFVQTQLPLYDFVCDDGVRHTLWKVDDEELIARLQDEFSRIDCFYVADGHHRSAAAVRVQEMRMKNNPHHTGEEEYNYFLSVIFPHDQMYIMEYNRVVKDLNGLTKDEFLDKISEKFDISAQNSAYKPDSKHKFGMYLDGKWYKIVAKPEILYSDDPVESLDISILHTNIIEPILDITNPRKDERINFVGGIRGLKELERLVESSEYALAFALYPTSIEELMRVADANKVMPPKSTWFEPKLRSGLVVHLLD